MEGTAADSTNAYWDALGPLAGSLVINGIAILLSLATLAFVAIATVKLYRRTRIAGSGYMLAALIGSISGALGFVGYLMLAGNDADRLAEDIFNLYEVICIAIGAFGYWRMSKAIVARAERGE